MQQGQDSGAAIEAIGLTRYYGKQRGVRDLDLTVPQGAILGLFGENGSGKTTTLKLAMGALLPDRGSIATLGVDPGAMPPGIRARIGWLPDSPAVPSRLRLFEAMEMQQAYFPTWNQRLADDLAHRFGLTRLSVFGQLTPGEKQRFMLTLVVAQMPELLVLDEPPDGLDPAVRRELVELLLEQAASRSLTIVVSSHILADMERLVGRVAFVKEGSIVAQGDLDSLRARVKRLSVSSLGQLEPVLKRFHARVVDQSDGAWRVVVDDFDAERLDGIEAAVEHLNLEELFLVYNAAPREKAA